MPGPADVLHDDVDRDAGLAQRFEDGGRDAWTVGDADHRDLRHVGFLRDPEHSLPVFHRHFGDDHRTHAVVEARADVDGHAVQLAYLDRARMYHTRTDRGQLEHLVVADMRELARGFHDARVGGED